MTTQEQKFIQLVALLRGKQINYFRTKSKYILSECIKLEKLVDGYIKQMTINGQIIIEQKSSVNASQQNLKLE